jgi:hypothetical protein
MDDPRGPLVTVVEVQGFDAEGWRLLKKSCGHVGQHASHFHYKVGEPIRCMSCKKEAP